MMKVVCKVNNLNAFTDENVLKRLKRYISMPDGEIDREVDLEIDKEYTVYGVVFWDNSPWYYICTEEYVEYPKPFAAEFFSVSDQRLSSYWQLSVSNQGKRGPLSSLVFEPWAEEPSFYERLVDGDPEAEAVFAHFRRLMDNE